MKPNDEIIALWQRRKDIYSAPHAAMGVVKSLYNGNLNVALPEIERNERPAIANLSKKGIDNYGMRIGSTPPDQYWPPDRAGFKEHEEKARKRRQAALGWWEMNNLATKLKIAGRWYVGYSWVPLTVTPNFRRGIPKWTLRSPETCYPARTDGLDDVCPRDCIFSYQQDYGWIEDNYPERAAMLRRRRDLKPSTLFTIVEYVDAEETVLLVVNESSPPAMESVDHTGSSPIVQLDRYPNRTDIPPVVLAQAIGLDSARGQFDDAVGIYEMQAKLMALAYITAKEGIRPERWWVGRDGRNPSIVRDFNAATGEPGLVKDADIKDFAPDPSFSSLQILDRLERWFRLDTGTAAEMGGEAASNIRTARRGEQVLSAVIDFPIQEAQEQIALLLQESNIRSAAVAKAYFGDQPTSFYVSWKGARGRVDYTPNDLFGDTYENKVIYSYAGADANNLVVGGGGRVGMGTLSKRSFMEMDPYVEDAETEHDRITVEGLEAALLAGVQQQVNEGAIPAVDVARMSQRVRTNQMELDEAVIAQQEEAQERQAQQVPPDAPEAMPGLAMPGMGAESGMAPPPNAPSVEDLSNRLRSIRGSLRGAA